MEYSVSGYRVNDLVRLDILINGENAPPLANIVHRDNSHSVGKALCRRLKELIPRQQFKVPLQAAIGQKIVASAAISPMRKDVLAKCCKSHEPGGSDAWTRAPALTALTARRPTRAFAERHAALCRPADGGDITRKKKLLQKQAKGKKRMKAIGKVNVPQEAFMAVLNLNSE